MTNNVPMLGKSPPPYQSIGVGILKDSSLMGVFPSISSPRSMKISTVNVISSNVGGMTKGKNIAEFPSLGPHEALYHAIKYTYYAYINDQHLVASNP